MELAARFGTDGWAVDSVEESQAGTALIRAFRRRLADEFSVTALLEYSTEKDAERQPG